jgi:hypothetical protein
MQTGKTTFICNFIEHLSSLTNIKEMNKNLEVYYCFNNIPDEYGKIETACKNSKFVSKITAIKNIPDLNQIQLKQFYGNNSHILIVLCDLQDYIHQNYNDTNISSLSSFLKNTRRNDISVIYEIHRFPYGENKSKSDFSHFFLNNYTAICLFKFLSNENQLNIWKSRCIPNSKEIFDECYKLAEKLAENSKSRPYIILMSDSKQSPAKKIRLDLFGLNLICFLN